MTVITAEPNGIPVHRVNLARGPSQLIVVPDEMKVDQAAETWSRFGKEVEFAHLQITATNIPYHYRLPATIALAEISRQVGRRPKVKLPPALRPPIYDHRLAHLAEAMGQLVDLEDLMNY